MTAGALLAECRAALSSAGIDEARFEAGQLTAFVCGASLTKLITSPETPVPEENCRRLRELVRRRISGEPLQYIIGEWEFYGLPFKVGRGVLIPRQDTETLVGTAIDFCAGKGRLRAADLCAGSGCVGIALAKMTGASVVCYELCEPALMYLKDNIKLNGVGELVKPAAADVLDPKTVLDAPSFDIIVFNPPYLTERDMRGLQKEVSFEPETALFGGNDGLDFYRAVPALWTPKLKSGGLIAAEIGAGQEREVERIFLENGITPSVKKDLCGINRVVFGIKN